MTRTSLLRLARDAELWAVVVNDSTTLAIDKWGDVIRFGRGVPATEVATRILRHQLGDRRGKVDDRKLTSELARHGYSGPSLRRAIATLTIASTPRRRAERATPKPLKAAR